MDAKPERSTDVGVGIVFLVILVDMIGFGVIIPFLTYMVQHLGGAERGGLGLWVALVMGAYAFSTFIFSPMWGSLSDRIGRRPVLMLGLWGNGLSFLAFGLSGSLEIALAVRLMHGFFNANIGVARAYIADISTPEQLAGRQGLIGVAFGVGFSIGPAIGGLLSAPAEQSWGGMFVGTLFESQPYLLPCAVSALLSTCGLVFAWRKLPESLPPESRVSGGSANPLVKLKENLVNIRAVLKRPIIAPVLWSMTFYWAGFTIMHVVLILFTMLDPSSGGLGFNEQDNGWVFMFVGVVGIITQGGLIRPLTKRYGSNVLMAVGFLLAGTGLASIPYVDASFAWIGILGVMVLVSVGNGLVTPSNTTLLSYHAGAEERGLVMGVSESLRALSSLVGLIMGGLIWDATVNRSDMWDFHTAFRLCGICAVLGFLCFRFSKAWHEESPHSRGGSTA
jgi:MFS family permease